MIEPNLETTPVDTLLEHHQSSEALAEAVFKSVDASLPAERAKAEKEMAVTGQALQELGSDRVDGRGQLIGSIPWGIYSRWATMLPGCWQDKAFVTEFLQDNPQCRAVGYRPVERNHGRKLSFTAIGAKFYHDNKAKVA